MAREFPRGPTSDRRASVNTLKPAGEVSNEKAGTTRVVRPLLFGYILTKPEGSLQRGPEEHLPGSRCFLQHYGKLRSISGRYTSNPTPPDAPISNAPISYLVPCGRGLPSRSTTSQGMVSLASIAGEPLPR
jgi:hypothetical protein